MLLISQLGWKSRSIVVFGVGGMLGPLLIPILLRLGPESSLSSAIRRFITATTPAWLLGPIEYSYGPLTTWVIILVVNVFLWAWLGLAVAFKQGTGTRFCAYGLASMLIAIYGVLIALSVTEILGAQIAFAILYVIANKWAKAATGLS